MFETNCENPNVEFAVGRIISFAVGFQLRKANCATKSHSVGVPTARLQKVSQLASQLATAAKRLAAARRTSAQLHFFGPLLLALSYGSRSGASAVGITRRLSKLIASESHPKGPSRPPGCRRPSSISGRRLHGFGRSAGAPKRCRLGRAAFGPLRGATQAPPRAAGQGCWDQVCERGVGFQVWRAAAKLRVFALSC